MTEMKFKRLVAGSYQTETLSGLYLQLMNGGDGWTVSSSTRTEGPFPTLREAKAVALAWDTLHDIESIGEGFKLDDDDPILGRYRLTLVDQDSEVITEFELGGDGYPLPIRKLGVGSLIQEVNDRLRWWEKAHLPAPGFQCEQVERTQA